MAEPIFEWDEEKDEQNKRKHGVSFAEAQVAFVDLRRLTARDLTHGEGEERLYCIGRVARGILTVRYVMRGERIRIIGAGFWRKGRKAYEEANKVHG